MSIRKKRICVVNDHKEQTKLLDEVFLQHTVFPTMCKTIKEAKKVLTTMPIDVVLTDLHLPDGLGLDILRFIKENKQLADIPVIMHSKESQMQTIHECIALGASDYIIKPCRPEVIIQKLRKLFYDSEIPEIVLTKDDKSKINLTTFGRVTHINEVSCMLECAIKFSPDQYIKINSAFLASLGVTDNKFKTTYLSVPGADKYYRSKIALIGLTDKATKKLKMVRNN